MQKENYGRSKSISKCTEVAVGKEGKKDCNLKTIAKAPYVSEDHMKTNNQ